MSQPCKACGRVLRSTNSVYCRTCRRRGYRVRQPKPVSREPVFSFVRTA